MPISPRVATWSATACAILILSVALLNDKPPACSDEIDEDIARVLVTIFMAGRGYPLKAVSTVEVARVSKLELESWPTYLAVGSFQHNGKTFDFQTLGNGCGMGNEFIVPQLYGWAPTRIE